MSDVDFFDESKAHSQVKARIVSNYFAGWANVIKKRARSNKLAYIDLFAGTGRYKDGTASTPLLVLDKVLGSPDLRDKFISIFVEKNKSNFSRLQKEIFSYPGIDVLRHPPQVINEEVGNKIVQLFQDKCLIPSLLFADPCGYRGLTLELINSVVKDWACECIFFFNYNRINMGLENPLVDSHMEAIFGQHGLKTLRKDIPMMKPPEREKCILSALTAALTGTYSKFVLPFRFEKEDGSRTSHYIVHVSKHQLGYEIMKEIMAKESKFSVDGIPSFEYSAPGQLSFLDRPFSLDSLKKDLLRCYAERRKAVKDVYSEHNVGTPYIKSNYKEAMLRMECEGRATAR
jgi:three-Cys-motif partner protein